MRLLKLQPMISTLGPLYVPIDWAIDGHRWIFDGHNMAIFSDIVAILWRGGGGSNPAPKFYVVGYTPEPSFLGLQYASPLLNVEI